MKRPAIKGTLLLLWFMLWFGVAVYAQQPGSTLAIQQVLDRLVKPLHEENDQLKLRVLSLENENEQLKAELKKLVTRKEDNPQ